MVVVLAVRSVMVKKVMARVVVVVVVAVVVVRARRTASRSLGLAHFLFEMALLTAD